MKTRQIVGGLLVVLLAVPGLFAGIMVHGMSRAILEGWFSPERARRVVRRLPESLERMLRAASDPSQVQDPEIRAWAKAVSETKPGPVEVARELGIWSWLDSEVPGLFAELRDTIHGKRAPGDVAVDLRPLKRALAGERAGAYLRELLGLLPPCGPEQLERWRAIAAGNRRSGVPACSPGPRLAAQSVQVLQERFRELPDEKVVVHMDARTTHHVNAARVVNLASWAILAVASLVLLLGSALAAGGAAGFARWAGIPALVASLPALLLGLAFKGAMAAAAHPSHWQVSGQDPFWETELGRVAAREVVWYVREMVQDLFANLTQVALVVGGLGLALTVLSFFLPKEGWGRR